MTQLAEGNFSKVFVEDTTLIGYSPVSDIDEPSRGYAHMYKLEAQPGNRHHWIYKKCWITHISEFKMLSIRTFFSEAENN